ncbi:MAG: hypothetical protein AB2A00_21430 [Myxococcota bacterium]
MSHRLLLGGAALLGALTLASPAHAFRYNCNSIDANGNQAQSDGCACNSGNAARWSTGFIDWRIKRAGTNQVNNSAWLTEATECLAAWNNVGCKNFLMRDIGDVTSPDFGTNESQHTIWWISSASQYQQVVGGGVDSTLGVTLSPYYFVGGCQGRDTVDSDIVMNNAGGATWTTNMANCSGNCVDVASTLVHELGHAFGLGHPCTGLSGDCPVGGTIMQAVSGYREDIGQPLQDDINGICDLYPGNPRGLGAVCNVAGDCDSNVCVDDNGVKYCSQSCTGTDCPTGYACQNNQCRRALPQVGETCTGSCVDGALCLQDTETTRHCYQQCTPGNDATCGANQRCADLGQGVGACVEAGTRQPGEECGGNFGDCRAGATCYIVEQGATTGVCFQDCTADTECASDQRCDTSGGTPGVCLGARAENAACGDDGFDSLCDENLICLCDDSQCGTAHCVRDCTANQSSCLNGQQCVLLSDNQTRVCVNTAVEGQSCNSSACGAGLLCIADAPNNGAHCYVDCSQQQCPQGKFCNTYGSGNDQVSICETEQAGTSSSSGGSSGASSGGGSTSSGGSSGGNTSSGGSSGGATSSGGGSSSGGNPNGAEFGQPCAEGTDCKSGMCQSTSNMGRICVSSCDPRVGHYDCNNGAEREGCRPNDPNDLSAGGTCLPGEQTGDKGLGEECSSGTECKFGICETGQCTVWCKPDGTCVGNDYTCDRTEVSDPGVCKPSGTGGSVTPFKCSCTEPGTRVNPAAGALLLLGLMAVRRRRA